MILTKLRTAERIAASSPEFFTLKESFTIARLVCGTGNKESILAGGFRGSLSTSVYSSRDVVVCYWTFEALQQISLCRQRAGT